MRGRRRATAKPSAFARLLVGARGVFVRPAVAGVAFAVVALAGPLAGPLRVAHADARTPAASAGACARVTRDNVARCALASAPSVRIAQEDALAAAGRVAQSRPWFPSNPVLSFSVARRAGTENRAPALNYGATLGQEVSVSGQRGAFARAAEADLTSRQQAARAAERHVAADAYAAYYEVLASREREAVARQLEGAARQVADVARARAEIGAGATLDQDVAEAAALRFTQQRIAAEAGARVAAVELAVLLGRDPAAPLAIEGPFEPLSVADRFADTVDPAVVATRPELRALAGTERMYAERAEALRRARVPNVTLQVFVQNDGYDEKVVGGGLSVPLPLPEPVGRLNSGAIAEADALARRTSREAEGVRRALTIEVAAAALSYRAKRAASALYPDERVARAESLLGEIAREIEAGRLSLRDAFVARQELIDVLHDRVETRRALCLASVALALAAGVPLENGP